MEYKDLQTVFESENIRYVKLSELLVTDYTNMVNDLENVGRQIGRKSTVTEDDELKWVRGKLEENAPIFSMLEKKSSAFIGNIEIMDVKDREGELGIAITADKQDMGYGTEAIPAFIRYMKEHFGLKRIFLKVYPDNVRAIHVYKKCGFTEYDRTDEDIFMEVT
ncbi:MAG: GNAT family N-acetyltransferase [Lachnospiraceae bacterium]|nr:GNAT family N-acetyltransferase [Lachnospiraceae bacterium]